MKEFGLMFGDGLVLLPSRTSPPTCQRYQDAGRLVSLYLIAISPHRFRRCYGSSRQLPTSSGPALCSRT